MSKSNNKKINKVVFLKKLIELNEELEKEMVANHHRSLPFCEMVFDRWERSSRLGFGKGTSVFDSSFIFGNPKVGKNCWIGPFTIIDGSGGLTIGDFCTISAGVHVYTHDTVIRTLTSGKEAISKEKVEIGKNVYIGPNTIIKKGVKVGDYAVIGAMSYVNKDVPAYSVAFGTPAIVKGKIQMNNGCPKIIYKK